VWALAAATIQLAPPAIPPSDARDHAEVVELEPPRAPPRADAHPPPAAPVPVPSAPARPTLRERGHRLIALPSFRADPTIGAMPGLRLRYVHRLPGQTVNRVQLDLGVRISTRLVQQHDLKVRLRDLLGHNELIHATAVVLDDPVFPYAGIDNAQRLSNAELGAPFYRGDVFTTGGAFDYQQPAWTVRPEQWGHPVGVLRWVVGAELQADRIRRSDDSLLAQERPDDEGWVRRGSVLGGMTWDSRDNEWSPTWGGLHEVTVAAAGPWAGASATYGRVDATFRWYRPLGTPKLVFAQRLTFDALFGDVPLFELGRFGGLIPVEGIGGRDAGRGFFRRRHAAPVKGLASTELRWQPFEWAIRRRTLGLGFKGFADLGEVFQPDGILADGLRVAGGGGLYFVWDRFFVFRGDFAVSPEGFQWYVVSGHAF
jgi:hypothetical protein